jgi:alpha-D-ribose 1-methylphosphonate 5-triphosphate synthase subunit PhnH
MSEFALSPLSPWHVLEQQRVFRLLMQTFAYPGRVVRLTDQDDVLIRCLATLADRESDLADPHRLLSREQWTLLEAGRAETDNAAFVVAQGKKEPDFVPRSGTLESPQQGATVIVQVDRLGDGKSTGQRLRLHGPGIQGQTPLQVDGLHEEWLHARVVWNADFPMGVDLLLVDGSSAAAIPRTTRILTMEGY